MNNRPTPETDAESCYPDSNLGECVCADFARKLERERDEAQADCLEQARLLGMGSEREARLISERDDLEFRRGLYKVQEQYLETARRERDEARFLLKQAQSSLDAIHLEVGGWIKIIKENTD